MPEPMLSDRDTAQYISLSDAAKELGVSPKTIRNRISAANIPTYQSGTDLRQRLIERKELRRWQSVRPASGAKRHG